MIIEQLYEVLLDTDLTYTNSMLYHSLKSAKGYDISTDTMMTRRTIQMST